MQTARIFDTLLFETALQAAATSARPARLLPPAHLPRQRNAARCATNPGTARSTAAAARPSPSRAPRLNMSSSCDLLGRIDPEGSVYDASPAPHLEAVPHPGPKPQAKPGPSAEACAKAIAAAFGIPLPAA